MAIDPPKKDSLYNRNAVRQLFSYAPTNRQKLEEQIDFNVDYIKSPMYKSRLEKMILTDVDSKGNFLNPLAKQVGAKKGEKVSDISNRIINMQLSNINRTNYSVNKNLPSGYLGLNEGIKAKDGTFLNQKVSISPSAINTEATAHEASHASLGGIQPYSKQFENKNVLQHISNQFPQSQEITNSFYYNKIPTELKAKIDAARYILKKAGIYDAGKETFNMSHYNKMLEYDTNPDNKNEVNTIGTLFGITSDGNYSGKYGLDEKAKNFIWLMNNIAKNKSNTDNSGLT